MIQPDENVSLGKGSPPVRKNVFFRALPELPPPYPCPRCPCPPYPMFCVLWERLCESEKRKKNFAEDGTTDGN